MFGGAGLRGCNGAFMKLSFLIPNRKCPSERLSYKFFISSGNPGHLGNSPEFAAKHVTTEQSIKAEHYYPLF